MALRWGAAARRYITVAFRQSGVGAIDVAARVQILDAFAAIRARNPRMAMLFVSHDLGVVQHIADRVLVLHEGLTGVGGVGALRNQTGTISSYASKTARCGACG